MYQSTAPVSGRPGFPNYPVSSYPHPDPSSSTSHYPYPPEINVPYHQEPHSGPSSGFPHHGGYPSHYDSPSGSQYSSMPGSAGVGGPSFVAQQRMPMSNGNSPRSMLHIVEYYPLDGEEATQVTVKLDAEFPPVLDQDGNPSQAQANKTLRILFGSTPVQTRVGPNSPKRTQDGGERYDGLYLYGTAPNPNSTGCLPVGSTFGQGEGMIERMSAPVYVQVLNPEGTVIETKQVGHFAYECGGKRPRGPVAYASSTASSRAVSLKRPGDPLMSDRVSPAPSHQGSFYGRRDLHDQGLPGQSPQLQVPYDGNSSPAYRNNRYAPGMSDGRGSPAVQVHDDRSGYSTYNSFPDQRSDPHGSNHSPAHPVPPQPHPIQRHPGSSGSPSNSSGSNVGMGGQPSLMRTSQLSSGSQPYPTYVGGNTKASLELQADLSQMAVGWNQEEWNARRRLVQFWRRQEGSTIHAAFRPISQAEYVPNSIVISCIFRADKNECYVTSVDAIYLLEALVGVRFSVEEKNRIRRNLEGFRPITVSKVKSEDFFKLIMSFPNPKPRNIEKDVKVFPWSIFGTALKKIISKYSASYVHAPNGNMGPPPSMQIERPISPPVSYVIPAPLMPADGSMGPIPGGPPFPAQSPFQGRPGALPYGDAPDGGPSSGHPGYGFESSDLFMTGAPNQQMPPTPAASTTYNGVSSSSSSSLPTLSHPVHGQPHGASSSGSNGNPMSRHASSQGMPLDGGGGYPYSGAGQPVTMSPSASSGSQVSGSNTGGFPGGMSRQVGDSPMHAPMEASVYR